MAETTSVADRLLEIASEEAGVGVDVRERVENPNWCRYANSPMGSDWTTCVDPRVIELWSELSLEAKIITFIHAEVLNRSPAFDY
jgi:hypothetical protein